LLLIDTRIIGFNQTMAPTFTLTHFFDPVAVQPVSVVDSIRKEKVEDAVYSTRYQHQNGNALKHAQVAEASKRAQARSRTSGSSTTPRRTGRGRRAGRFQDPMAEDPLQRAIQKSIAEDSIQVVQAPPMEDIYLSEDHQVIAPFAGGRTKKTLANQGPPPSASKKEAVLDSILSSFASRNDGMVLRNTSPEIKDDDAFEAEEALMMDHADEVLPLVLESSTSVASSSVRGRTASRGNTISRNSSIRSSSPAGSRSSLVPRRARSKSTNRRSTIAHHRVGEVLGNDGEAEEENFQEEKDDDEENLVFDGAAVAASIHSASGEGTSRGRGASVPRRKRESSVTRSVRSGASSADAPKEERHPKEGNEYNSKKSRGRKPSRKQSPKAERRSRSKTQKRTSRSRYPSDTSQSSEEEERVPRNKKAQRGKGRHSSRWESDEDDYSRTSDEEEEEEPPKTSPVASTRRSIARTRGVSKGRRRLLCEPKDDESPPDKKAEEPRSPRRMRHSPKQSNNKLLDTKYDEEDDDDEARILPNRGSKKETSQSRNASRHNTKEPKRSADDRSFEESSDDRSYGDIQDARDTSDEDDESLSSTGRDTASRSSYDDDHSSYDSGRTGAMTYEDDHSQDWRQNASDYYNHTFEKVDKKMKKVTHGPEFQEVNARAEIIGKQALWAADEISKGASSMVDQMNQLSAKDVELAVERAYMNVWEWANGTKENKGAVSLAKSKIVDALSLSEDVDVAPVKTVTKRYARTGRVSRRKQLEAISTDGPLDTVAEE
jgi:hypothetical protein